MCSGPRRSWRIRLCRLHPQVGRPDLRPANDLYFFNIGMTGAPRPRKAEAIEEHPARANSWSGCSRPGHSPKEHQTALYDESRSFENFMPLATHGIEAGSPELIRRGVHKGAGSGATSWRGARAAAAHLPCGQAVAAAGMVGAERSAPVDA